MEIGRINGLQFLNSVIDMETGKPVQLSSMEVIQNMGIIPVVSAIIAGIGKYGKVTLAYEAIYDEDGTSSDGCLVVEVDDDDEELLELVDQCSEQIEMAIAEKFAREGIEDE